MVEGRFTGKVVVIASNAGELGLVLARSFAEAGSRAVVVAAPGREGDAVIASALHGEELAIMHEELNVRDPAKSAALVDRLVEQFGHVDVWVNAFTISNPGSSIRQALGPAEIVASSTWDESIASILSSAFYCAQAVGRQMLSQGHGVIANLASVTGFKVVEGDVTGSVAHAGLMSLTKALGVEWAGRGVRVVGVALPLELEEASRRTPLRRAVTAPQIAEALLYLTSDEATYVTAETISVDGGWSAYQLF
jgi:NAD(P)-dependent dehydrogenase (short-subunit alcohol dehydrogenase family)